MIEFMFFNIVANLGPVLGTIGYQAAHRYDQFRRTKDAFQHFRKSIPAGRVQPFDHFFHFVVSKACDKEKEACACKWGNCLRKDGMAASNCCSADYKFKCCETTLLPEQKLEKTCNDAATLCQCGWAKSIETDGFKASLCCKEAFQFKCCVDPTELILELRAKDECKTANLTCFCDVSNYEGWRRVL
uniref:Uncharacterized protein n=1 Tax=Globodera rostochiensis TaxID=31243 RepID=A0A914GY98_GLORO